MVDSLHRNNTAAPGSTQKVAHLKLGYHIIDGIGQVHLIAQSAIEPIQTVKVKYLGSNNPRLHSDEVLIALASSANAEPKAAEALRALADLKGCQAHCSVILSPADEITYRKLGLQLTCEPQYQTNKLYHR